MNRDDMAWTDRAAALDEALKRARLSSAEVGRRLGVDPSNVSRWRSGERVPDAEQLAVMLEMAGASADEMLGLWSTQLEQRLDRARQERDALDAAIARAERARR